MTNTSKKPRSAPAKGAWCDCVERVNTAMADQGQNQQVACSYRTIGGEFRAFAIVETEKIEPRKKRSPRLIATFCPFCGEKYPDAWPASFHL